MEELIKNYLVNDLKLPIDAAELKNDTPLLSSRLVDSISALLLVEFIEKTFKIQFKPHEVSEEYLNTIDKIVTFIRSKESVLN